jgi:hypothetical protein
MFVFAPMAKLNPALHSPAMARALCTEEARRWIGSRGHLAALHGAVAVSVVPSVFAVFALFSGHAAPTRRRFVRSH